MAAQIPARRALLSVSDKRGLVPFAQRLVAAGVELISTGGTLATLRAHHVPAKAVAEVTGAPEILDGRVKTLHPRIHAGILARPTPEHESVLAQHEITPIDFVIVNLYPFEATIAEPTCSFATAIENIDIGGPAMVRAAAKNHERVAVVVSPDDYDEVAAAAALGPLAATLRFRLARKAFAHTASYDAAIATYLASLEDDVAAAPEAVPARAAWPSLQMLTLHRAYPLRYGENPHQQAAFYRDPHVPLGLPSLATAEVLGGKALSYNNLLDLEAALRLACEFEAPLAVVVKHNNPCGVATAATLAQAYTRAREADSVSAFGGIVALNRVVDEATAGLLVETFLECVVAPGYEPAAQRVLERKKNLRVVAAAGTWGPAATSNRVAVRSLEGGWLLQTPDDGRANLATAACVTTKQATPAEREDAEFAWRVAKHVKSNAIVFAKAGCTVAIGAGQMSRVDAVLLCEQKAGAALRGCAVASDAFFPFRDGVDVLAAAGAVVVVQPGGSIRDAEVIAAANEHGLAMLLTGMRHFRH